MLAERRERKKWSVNPNGTNWSQDTNKFGSRMLEKMGWTHGKGLGANEDGSTENIKVKKKNDLRGVGCSMNEAHNWVAHQDDFSSILAQLNDHHTDQSGTEDTGSTGNGVTNLEKHSKSQKRVHYHKFTRGKDLSNYKDDDLAAIFGKRATKSEPVTPINLSENESSGADSSSSSPEKKRRCKKRKLNDESLGERSSNHVTSSLSVQEYFAKRMAMLKNKMSAGETESRATSSAEAETGELKVGSESFPPTKQAEVAPVETKKAKKKKKARVTVKDSDCKGGDSSVHNAARTERETELPKKKLKSKGKKKISKESQDTDQLTSDGALSLKKKSKKRKANGEVSGDVSLAK